MMPKLEFLAHFYRDQHQPVKYLTQFVIYEKTQQQPHVVKMA